MQDDMANAPPWYRQFWPWLLIALPGTVVIACIVTITIALKHPDPVVNDDWFKDGMAINQVNARDEVARTLGIQVTVSPDHTQGLVLRIRAQQPLPSRITLHLQHPTRHDADIERIVLLDNGIAQTGALPLGDTNHWYMSVESLPDETPAWRVRGRWETGSESVLQP